MPTISSLHGGIAENNVYMGENQCAYAENLYIRDPEGVTLAQKPENMFLTGTDLMLSYDDDGGFGGGVYSGENGKVLDGNGNIKLEPVDNITDDIGPVNDTFHTIRRYGRGYIALSDTNVIYAWVDASDGYPFSTYPSFGPQGGVLNDGNFIIISERNGFQTVLVSEINFDEGKLPAGLGRQIAGRGDGVMCLMHFTGQSIIGIGVNGKVVRRDGYSDIINTKYYNELEFWQAFYHNGTHYIIPGDSHEHTGFGYLQGDIFKQIAHQGETDGHKKYNLGRKYRYGHDLAASVADKVYIANNDKLASYGKDYSIFRDAYTIDLTHASNGVKIEEIGLVSSTIDPGYIQFAWRDVDGNCGVDKLSVRKPTRYVSEGIFYSRKYQLGTDKLKTVRGFKMRADTMNGTAIDIYVSIDGGDFTHVCTHSDVGQEILKPYSHNFQAREIQWKFVFSTIDENSTPTFKAFTFDLG